jgi:hypothetical protein
MYIDHHGTEEYPFYATFYHLGVDESKPLDEQVEEKIVSFETPCDVSDQDTGLNNDKLTLFFPFDATGGDTIAIGIGESVEVESYGLVQKGRVLGVFPSQLGGIKVMCTRI